MGGKKWARVIKWVQEVETRPVMRTTKKSQFMHVFIECKDSPPYESDIGVDIHRYLDNWSQWPQNGYSREMKKSPTNPSAVEFDCGSQLHPKRPDDFDPDHPPNRFTYELNHHIVRDKSGDSRKVVLEWTVPQAREFEQRAIAAHHAAIHTAIDDYFSKDVCMVIGRFLC